jgi:hypothetical protein
MSTLLLATRPEFLEAVPPVASNEIHRETHDVANQADFEGDW